MTAMAFELAAGLPRTLVLWDVDHTLIENGGVSKETYELAFELLTGRSPAVRPTTDGRTDFQIMHGLLASNSVNVQQHDGIGQFENALIEAMKIKAPELPQRGHVLSGVVEALKILASIPVVIQSVLTGNIVHNTTAKRQIAVRTINMLVNQLALCGVQVLAASLTVPGRDQCQRCQQALP